jgi:hypothetical protein
MDRVLFKKLTGSQLVNKFPLFYANRWFTTAFTRPRHLSLFWARSIQPMTPSYFLKIHFNTILPSIPGSSKWSLSLRFSHQTLYTTLLASVSATCPAHLILLETSPVAGLMSSYRIYLHYILFPKAQQPIAGQGLFTKASWSHLETQTHSIGFLWTSDQPVAETYIWQQTTLTTDKHPCSRRDSNPQSLRRRDHWYRLSSMSI